MRSARPFSWWVGVGWLAGWGAVAGGLAGCITTREAARPAIPPDADTRTRQKIYEDYRFTWRRGIAVTLPFVTVSGAGIERRAGLGGGNSLNDVFSAYEESRSIQRESRRRIWVWLGGLAAGEVAIVSTLANGAGILTVPMLADGVAAVYPVVHPASAARLADAYNRGLAHELGLTATDTGSVMEAAAADLRWRPWRIGISGALGLTVPGRSDLTRLYRGGLDWDGRKPFAPPLFGVAADVSLSERVQIGVWWEPRLYRRHVIRYTDGTEDQWRMDAMGILGRLRVLFPAGIGFSLVGTGAVGRYALTGAKYAGTYWVPETPLQGSAMGGIVAIGAERLLARNAAIGVDFGYRFARLRKVSAWQAGVINGFWDGQPLRNADGSAASIDHSGPVLETSWRYYFSDAVMTAAGERSTRRRPPWPAMPDAGRVPLPLEDTKLGRTMDRLSWRIEEWFPGSGLARLAGDFLRIARGQNPARCRKAMIRSARGRVVSGDRMSPARTWRVAGGNASSTLTADPRSLNVRSIPPRSSTSSRGEYSIRTGGRSPCKSSCAANSTRATIAAVASER